MNSLFTVMFPMATYLLNNIDNGCSASLAIICLPSFYIEHL